jgi:hypothetical protein
MANEEYNALKVFVRQSRRYENSDNRYGYR